MGSFIAKQPNGLYCRFSTVVDTVTDWNMSEEDYINLCVSKAIKKAMEDAKDILKNYVKPFDEVKNRFCPNNNTIEEFEKMLHEMGDTEGLGKERIDELNKLLKY